MPAISIIPEPMEQNMPETTPPLPVAVVGAGRGGLAAARLLARVLPARCYEAVPGTGRDAPPEDGFPTSQELVDHSLAPLAAMPGSAVSDGCRGAPSPAVADASRAAEPEAKAATGRRCGCGAPT